MARKASGSLNDSNLILLDRGLEEAAAARDGSTSPPISTSSCSVPASPFVMSAMSVSNSSMTESPPPELALPKAVGCVSRHAADMIRREAEALLRLADRIEGGTAATDGFHRAMELFSNMHPHAKLVVTGLGKSAIVGRKAVATFCSLGLPAVFIDPIAALHGDVGVLSPHGIDVALMISYSGRTAELVRLLPTLQARCKGGIIALTGDPSAMLSVTADCWLDGMIAGDHAEADAHVPAPSSSALVALAQLDALALCSLRIRAGWEAPGTSRAAVFAHHHEGGQLGIKLKALNIEKM